jgi:hypothetical protein
MGTLLSNRRMSPELRARIEASVRGRRVAAGSRLRARSISLLRLLSFAVISGAVALYVINARRSEARFELARGALLGRARTESAALTARDRAIVARVMPWLARAAGTAFSDLVAPELAERGLSTVLARPTVYVRLPLAGVHGSASLEQAAAQSFKDALVLCLLDPPASRSEKLLVSRARRAYAGQERMGAGAQVTRLYDAISGLPFLSREWERKLLAAEDERALGELERRFNRAPLAAAKRAAKAELLLFALDEPSDGSGPIELDGERPHHVRVGLVDLEADRLLLAFRRHVDPSWVSAANRAEYASGIDSCSLALDAQALVTGSRVASKK